MTFIGGAPFGKGMETDGFPPACSEREVSVAIVKEFVSKLDPEWGRGVWARGDIDLEERSWALHEFVLSAKREGT
jgi:hypothetical protein